MKKKNIALLLSVVLVLAGAVGFTIAWLTDGAGPVNNTFTVGNIDIDITETDSDDADNDPLNNSYKMIPGFTIAKDPKVIVEGGSEACWLFVTVEESENFGDFLTYEPADGWTAGTGDADGDGKGVPVGVYFREVPSRVDNEEDAIYSILKKDQVVVQDTVVKANMDAIEKGEAEEPTLTFNAEAIQVYKSNDEKFTAAQAWNELHPTT